jgi:hypothetical protein
MIATTASPGEAHHARAARAITFLTLIIAVALVALRQWHAPVARAATAQQRRRRGPLLLPVSALIP